MHQRYFLPILLLICFVITACNAGVEADSAVTNNDESASSENSAYISDLRGGVVEPPREIQDFSLPATTGGEFTFSDYEGKILLVYFGYLTCPDICPATSADMTRILNTLDETASSRVQVAFFTIDPERDTIERLDAWLSLFHPDIVGVRGDGTDLQMVMDQFGVQTAVQRVGDSPLSYLMDHTATVFLVAPDGRLWEQFLFGTSYIDILHDLELILAHMSS